LEGKVLNGLVTQFSSLSYDEVISGQRTTLVRLPKGIDSSFFGGWGVRI
jgi:hypothetical protein